MMPLKLVTLAGSKKPLGYSLYDLYDDLTPDAIQPEKVYSFVKNDLFSPSFWKRQGNALKNDPLAFAYDYSKKIAPDYIGDVQDYLINKSQGWIIEYMKGYVKAYIESEYGEEIEALGNEKREFIKSINSKIRFPQDIRNNIQLTVNSVSSAVLTALGAPWAIPAVLPIVMIETNRIIDKIWHDAIEKAKRVLFPEYYKAQKELQKMAGLSPEILQGLVYSDYDPENNVFRYIAQPPNDLPPTAKIYIDNLALKFKPMFASLNNSDQKYYEELSEYIFFMTYSQNPAFKEFVQNPANNEQAATYIAVQIFAVRALMLNEMLQRSINSSGAGFASFMSANYKQGLTWKDVLGRWRAGQAKGAFEAKLAEDRKRWAEEASKAGSMAEYQKAKALVAQKDNVKKVATWGIGLYALSKLF